MGSGLALNSSALKSQYQWGEGDEAEGVEGGVVLQESSSGGEGDRGPR